MENQKEKAGRLVRERLMSTLAERISWREQVRKLLREEQDIYIWGTGQVGQRAAHELRGMGGRLRAFVDNDPDRWGQEMDGTPCISPVQLQTVQDPLVLIGVGMHSGAVAGQLAAMGVRRTLEMQDFYLNEMFDDLLCADPVDVAVRVERCFELLADEHSCDVLLAKLEGFFHFTPGFGKQNYYDHVCRGDQYFQDDLIHFTEDSVLVDCGAYTGDTMQDFLRRGYPFHKYIAYELSRRSYEMLQENMQNVRGGGTDKLIAYNCGVGECEEIVHYDDAIRGNTISASGVAGKTVRLSDHLRDEPVSFIKMDIEGAESTALKGAAELICRRRPDLAICTYHAISDLYEVPLYIHSLVPEYRLYLRHHTPVHYETVCYAVI